VKDAFLSYGRQWIDEDDLAAVRGVLESDFLTQGPWVSRFEESIKEITEAKYCVAVSSATAGLHLAVEALRLGKGAMGVTSPNTFVASANCMVYNNVRPVFSDIDQRTYCLSPALLEERITQETQLLIPVHFAGQAAGMNAIASIGRKRGLHIIEDAAHALGSRYADGRPVGCCSGSDMTVFSFHPVKTVTTGEGGAVTTNDPRLYDRLCLLRSHGIRKPTDASERPEEPWFYEMINVGYNYRMSDIHAALGWSQLKKLPMFARRRRQIVNRYTEAFTPLDWLTVPHEENGLDSCFHLYVLLIDFQRIQKSRGAVMRELKEKGIGTQVHYIPVHTQPFYADNFAQGWGKFPVAEHYYARALSIPLFPRMTDADVERVVDAITALTSR
jgi:UDP-4-amino-4,6-dideoxy-N-acetyl-beta-L-altrosamine transaminase